MVFAYLHRVFRIDMAGLRFAPQRAAWLAILRANLLAILLPVEVGTLRNAECCGLFEPHPKLNLSYSELAALD